MIVVNNKKELKSLIIQRIREQGLNCNLNDIDVSRVTDMSELFMSSKFNGDISEWNVSNVKNTFGIFDDSPIEGNELGWWRARLN